MQFFLANLYSERLSAPLTAEESTTPSLATAVANDETRPAELALAGSR